MTYGMDLRERVVAFCRGGGKKTEAARRFGIHRHTVNCWLQAEILTPKKHGRRRGKLDWAALERDVAAHPDKLLRERAAAFGVAINSIWYATQQLKISHKKNS